MKELTREEFEKMLQCGKNYRPSEITDSKFYFFKNYLIQLCDGGGYYLFERKAYNSIGKGDVLKTAMDEIVERELKKFDNRIKNKKQADEIVQKRLKDFVRDVTQTVLEKYIENTNDESLRGY